MARTLYNVEIRQRDGTWYAMASCQCVGLERARGICIGIGLAYPCPDRRIVERGTGRVVDELPGQGAVLDYGRCQYLFGKGGGNGLRDGL